MRRFGRILAYVSGAGLVVFALAVGYLLSREADLVFYGGVGDRRASRARRNGP